MLPALSLHQIGKATGTDKYDQQHSFNGLSYLDVYAKYVDELRDQPINLLELGVKDGAVVVDVGSIFSPRPDFRNRH